MRPSNDRGVLFPPPSRSCTASPATSCHCTSADQPQQRSRPADGSSLSFRERTSRRWRSQIVSALNAKKKKKKRGKRARERERGSEGMAYLRRFHENKNSLVYRKARKKIAGWIPARAREPREFLPSRGNEWSVRRNKSIHRFRAATTRRGIARTTAAAAASARMTSAVTID